MNGLVQIMNKPPWLVAVTALIALAGSFIAPSILSLRTTAYIQSWTIRNLSRQSKIEKELDPGRSSSRLRRDGSDPRELEP